MSPPVLPTQSSAYTEARARLLEAELELTKQREEVAALRRALPAGPEVPDWRLQLGPDDLDAGDDAREVGLGDLFTGPDRPLIVYHFMFGKAHDGPCPMCSMWIHGFDALAPYVEANAELAVVAATDLASLRGYARRRGWRNVRLLSAGDSTFKLDLGSEDADGHQQPFVSVFTRDADGTVRHHYTGGAHLDGDRWRGVDLLSPVWHLLDLTPQGRGDWMPAIFT